ncbi:MAG: FtsX-like permease family protein [Thermodesulfobacteriota bacterium]
MKLHNIAVNNLRRRKAKMVFLISGLMIGIAAIVALITTIQILSEDIAHKMDEFGANIVITPKSEGLSLNYGGINLGGVSFDLQEISESDLDKIETIKNAANVRIISPKVFGIFEHQGQKALALGVDFPAELTLKRWWKITGEKPSGLGQILVGHEAAERFQLKPGSQVRIQDKEFQVSGVLENTGSQDDQLFFMPLRVAQRLFGKEGKIAMAEVAALCHNCPISDIVTQISEKIPAAKVTALQQVVASRMDALHNLEKFSLMVAALILLVGSMVVFVTMMGSVNERTREIGIFSAIGFRKSHIMKIILLEALIVSIASGVLGYLVGIGATRVAMPFFTEHVSHFSLDPLVAAGAVLLAIVIGLTASFYPATTASKMDPSEALRTL